MGFVLSRVWFFTTYVIVASSLHYISSTEFRLAFKSNPEKEINFGNGIYYCAKFKILLFVDEILFN